MTNKSVAQRVTEIVALILVGGTAITLLAPVVYRALAPQIKPAEPSLPVPVALAPAATSPAPLNPPVKSVKELPASYPQVEEVAFAPGSAHSLTAQEAAKVRPSKDVVVRHLNARVGNDLKGFLLSPDGSRGVVVETTPASTTRFAVWDLDQGKLLRFLGAEPGKSVQPYSGRENAEFGATVDFSGTGEYAISPSGRRFAARMQAFLPDRMRVIYAWELETGKLLTRYEEPQGVGLDFMFSDEDHVVHAVATSELQAALVRLNVVTGSTDLLTPVSQFLGFHTAAVHDESLAWISENIPQVLATNTREMTLFQPLDGEAPFRYSDLWFSADGDLLFGCTNERLDTWNVAAGNRSGTLPWPDVAKNRRSLLPAPEVGRVAISKQEPEIVVLDVATGEVATTIYLPFRGGFLRGNTSNARRLVVSTDQQSLLIVDFTAGLPAGKVKLAEYLTAKLPATR